MTALQVRADLPADGALLISSTGLARMTAELERLKTFGREAIADRLRHARDTEADATASGDYLAARDEQAQLEAKIARLQSQLDTIQVATGDPSDDVVDLGERVRLRNLDTGRRAEYELVSSLEVDVTAGRISVASPVGRALIGRRKGDVALVDVPAGRVRLRIVAIEPARTYNQE